ncbi:glycoside hydrolase family 31 protein [Salisediminibacterium halotolerans]|uniref:glycoside hydrolase family 31 protein n=1 Tax=Salisediminibacterium halotolerans TaxID=517425 RepID=UPI000EAE046D|nr:glycoside hydrolase family 31 protein [Salisediminibacterium halotolerans]RLJ73150.1 uncharacterized protein DUF4968 [Actinophytocola xinjiangensis]RPE86572.1 uncharacterized protein DUF4968 [Salisediminibacterium halotolerans]TWG33947.1 uncharacterized protein DUF4968 [Salisediminibacterium halotolerans]GEL06646.1 alpha-glucosidase [Salisediminibacterium halotolerans]
MTGQQGTIQGEHYRFTVLTEKMIRMEYSEDGIFEDRATQTVVNRDFPAPNYTVYDNETSLDIITDTLHLTYDKQPFSRHGLQVHIKSPHVEHWKNTWRFGDSGWSLPGTARTLDMVDGETELEPGVLTKDGYALIDDSNAAVLDGDWISPRKDGIEDLYLLAYPKDYKTALRDFFHLCGKTPMLPRYALGNWWSRYYAYTQDEYLALMDRFEEEGVPFSVAVIDMDWHLTDIDSKYGHGWTGYTWNRELFPDPLTFMRTLHDKGLRVSLNVHPADGVRAFEEPYEQMAKDLGVDPATEQPLAFDIANKRFAEAYFKHLHHPHERDGVDFWWIDWQQGTDTSVPGLDPLWMLNHFHYRDHAKRNSRPLIFSRYAGIGSHRYPIGFSGDTVITWESLDFQPYFTAMASNAGYGWWSHDIGGHMFGYKDAELMIRWLQFGVFAPITRLHSTKNLFSGKEPWRFGVRSHQILNRYLRFRHQLLPYMHTMNARFHYEDEPVVQPMYYDYPHHEDAYHVPNQYAFGSELIAAPITTPMNRAFDRGSVTVWLPEGTYTDIFTGLIYDGGRMITVYRRLDEIPVFAKAGAILPLSPALKSSQHGVSHPESLDISIFPGADGSFRLYEDNDSEKSAVTPMVFRWNDNGVSRFELRRAEGNLDILPEKRTYTLRFNGMTSSTLINVLADDGVTALPFEREDDRETDAVMITLDNRPVNNGFFVEFPDGLSIGKNNLSERIFNLLNEAETDFVLKETIYARVCSDLNEPHRLISSLQAIDLPDDLYGALAEIILA